MLLFAIGGECKVNATRNASETESESLLEAWELAAESGCSDAFLREVLRLLRGRLPFQSLSVFSFDGDSKRLRSEGYAGVGGAPLPEQGDRECSDSKWSELLEWIGTSEVLRQNSPRRSGKLALLAPEQLAGESLAFPLNGRGDAPDFGAFVVEIEHGRSLHEDRIAFLHRWTVPIGLALRRTLEQRRGARKSEPVGLNTGGDSKGLRELIVGAESGLRSVMERVQLVATSDIPVLILGDTGTGKEVVARAIHLRSPRSHKPFLRVNCGAIPTELIDSQLFGHERGSFTGASDQRKGWFERADGGTLFLDEIGELPLAAQVRLLRVLQEKQIERVGGQETIHVDVRIVAATHRDLAAMVHERAFREDLWYRINMFPILLPRLCERIEDIPALAKHFARKAATSFGFPYVEPSASDMERLIDYHWPGNIRELQAVIDRAVILGRGMKLDIPTALGIGLAQRYQPAEESNEPTFYEVIPESPMPRNHTAANPSQAAEDGRVESLNESIRRQIERALIHSNGQIEGKRGAANTLQINPHTLRAKMRKLGIRWTDFRRD